MKLIACLRNSKFLSTTVIFLSCLLATPLHLDAKEDETIKAKVTVLVASNRGTDMNLVNDDYKDELIKLFSYTDYQEVNVQAVDLQKSNRIKIDLPERYELVLTYQGQEDTRSLVQALIRKNTTQYVFTVLSMLPEGVVFLGGPPLANGDIVVIVLEKSF